MRRSRRHSAEERPRRPAFPCEEGEGTVWALETTVFENTFLSTHYWRIQLGCEKVTAVTALSVGSCPVQPANKHTESESTQRSFT